MRWVVVFENSPHLMWAHADRTGEHLDYLRDNQAMILMAGGLHGPSDGSVSGGFWVLETDGRDQAVELIEGDPYFIREQRRYRLQSWEEAFELDRAAV